MGRVGVRAQREQITYPSAVRRVVVHDDLGLSIFKSIPHNPTMIITYTRIVSTESFNNKK